jgi:hypothetical protein
MKTQEFKVKSNKSKRIFTIWSNGSKYRTNRLSREEFDEMEYFERLDWTFFLRDSADYYLIK